MNEQLKQWKRMNKQILASMFAGNLMKIWKAKDVSKYIDSAFKIYDQQPARQSFYAHSTITKTIGLNFRALDWIVYNEYAYGAHRFDLLVVNGAKNIIVEVKPFINRQDMGQIAEYIYTTTSLKKCRLFLGTDILNMEWLLFGKGTGKKFLMDYAYNYNLGVIFATKEIGLIFPSEFLLA